MRFVWERIGIGDLEGHAPPAPRRVPAGAAMSVAADGQGAVPAVVAPPPGVAATLTMRRPPVQMAYFVRRGPGGTETIPVAQEITEIGRDPRNHVVVDDPMVSGFHARLTRAADGRYVLEDRNSSNGTYVNNELLSAPRSLADNDIVRLGETFLTLKVVEPAPVPTLVPAPAPAPVAVAGPPPRVQSSQAVTVALRRPRRALAFLVETEGAEAGRIYQLSESITLMGRDPRNEIVLAEPSVSSFHARIMRGLDGGIAIEDLESTNGTLLNGVPLEAVRHLDENDEIRIGSTAFQFKVAG
jgi:pSer/pThr/pTyr-binding forkhead associated (FHA) protein